MAKPCVISDRNEINCRNQWIAKMGSSDSLHTFSILNNSSEKVIKYSSYRACKPYSAFFATWSTFAENIFLNCIHVERRNLKVWSFWGFTHGKWHSCLCIWEKGSLVIYSKAVIHHSEMNETVNSKNIIVFICLKFCVIFSCRILCKLLNIIFNSPYKLALSFYLYHAQRAWEL